MIELTEALSIVLDAARPLSSERVDLDAALHRVLAEDIASDIEQPAFDIPPKTSQIGVGQVVLRRGSRVKPQHIGILASVGCVRPLMTRRPKVALLAAGAELVEPGEKPGPAQVRDCNGPQLAAQLARMGIGVNDYGTARDISSDASRVLAAALTENDVVLITGVSAGDRDSVSTILRQQGVGISFEEIAVEPGKLTVFGRSRRGACFGLFGNPASAFVIFELLVKPFLWKLMGHEYPPVIVYMPLRGGTLMRNKGVELLTWIPVRIVDSEAEPCHKAAGPVALDEADGLAAVDGGVVRVEEGTPSPVRLILD
jgi:molybdopterin molybdotransferase